MLWTSEELEGLGVAMSVDGASGDAYVAGFTYAEDVDAVVVHKVTAGLAFIDLLCAVYRGGGEEDTFGTACISRHTANRMPTWEGEGEWGCAWGPQHPQLS